MTRRGEARDNRRHIWLLPPAISTTRVTCGASWGPSPRMHTRLAQGLGGPRAHRLPHADQLSQ